MLLPIQISVYCVIFQWFIEFKNGDLPIMLAGLVTETEFNKARMKNKWHNRTVFHVSITGC